jgi:hypothetical protein
VPVQVYFWAAPKAGVLAIANVAKTAAAARTDARFLIEGNYSHLLSAKVWNHPSCVRTGCIVGLNTPAIPPPTSENTPSEAV